MTKNRFVCKEKTCHADLSDEIGITTETTRVFTKDGYSDKEFTKVKRYFCPICGTTVRRKLGEEIQNKLSMEA